MKKLDIVITMAGLGSRFKKAGYNVPKYMIEAKGKTLFQWSMISLEGFNDIVDKYIFIVMRDEKEDVENFIISECAKMNIENYRLIIINYLTDGQATTALLAEKYWKDNNSLLIYNIDTYIEANEINSNQVKGDGFIPCFEGEGDHWSFVKIDNSSGEAIEVKEKERISKYCTIGAYYFATCKLYKEVYNEYYSDKSNLVNGEKYVAPLYNYLISNGKKVYISNIPKEKIHVLGTPDELNKFLNDKK